MHQPMSGTVSVGNASPPRLLHTQGAPLGLRVQAPLWQVLSHFRGQHDVPVLVLGVVVLLTASVSV